jgi:hypothetical protein
VTAMDLGATIAEIAPAMVVTKASVASTKRVLHEPFDFAFRDVEVTSGKTPRLLECFIRKALPLPSFPDLRVRVRRLPITGLRSTMAVRRINAPRNSCITRSLKRHSDYKCHSERRFPRKVLVLLPFRTDRAMTPFQGLRSDAANIAILDRYPATVVLRPCVNLIGVGRPRTP